MTPTEIGRRSDALYADGTRGMTRRVLCDMVAQRESDLEDARAEFDKMDKWHSAELQAALAENAKLRELATYALKHIIEVWCEGEGRDLYRGKPCEDCADAFSSDCPKCMPRMFDVSGIEVDA